MVINNIPFTCELSDILTELQSQLEANGIPLLQRIKDVSNDIMVSCPYHKNGQERKPSAGISKHDGTFHCFTCNESHSLQQVISYCFGKTEDIVGAFGWNWLLKNFLTVEIENRKPINLSMSRSNKVAMSYVSEEELDSYRYYHPYMFKRKLTKPIIELFDIGYDKNTQCITFPVRDIKGNTLFIARRNVNYKYFNYPEDVEKPLYGLYELNCLDSFPSEIIICESMLDALSCWVYGKYAVALNGLGTPLQFSQLRNLPCRKLILATDNDEYGMKARQRIRHNIREKLVTQYILPPNKKDINDLTQEEFLNLKETF